MAGMEGARADHVLALLCFFEDAREIIDQVRLEYFASRAHREIADAALSHWRQYKRPPGVHLRDELYGQLSTGDDRAELLDRVLQRIEAQRTQINVDYVLGRFGDFIVEQTVRAAVLDAQAALDRGDVLQAQQVLARARHIEARPFDAGVRLTDTDYFHSVLEGEEEPYLYPLNIQPLTEIRCAPARGTLFLFMALPGYGKSWFLVHCGKCALQYHYKVVHITLEMSTKQTYLRYLQSVMGAPREDIETTRPVLQVLPDGGVSLAYEELHADGLRTRAREIESRLKYATWNLIIKQFPTRGLSVEQLELYLDTLADRDGFQPDVLIVDYADEMMLQGEPIRQYVSENYKGLRRIATERGLAVITATQSNRVGAAQAGSKLTAVNLSEDFSKAHTADIFLTYNQTDQERELQLARLWVAKNRDAPDRKMVLISQNYALGQFALNGLLLRDEEQYKETRNQAHRRLLEDGEDEPEY